MDKCSSVCNQIRLWSSFLFIHIIFLRKLSPSWLAKELQAKLTKSNKKDHTTSPHLCMYQSCHLINIILPHLLLACKQKVSTLQRYSKSTIKQEIKENKQITEPKAFSNPKSSSPTWDLQVIIIIISSCDTQSSDFA